MFALLGIAMDINERIRSIQRRERVQMIATRVRAVPAGMNIVKDGREFVMDDHFFREQEVDDRGHIRGRAGKALPLADLSAFLFFPPLFPLSLSLSDLSLSLSLFLARSLSLSQGTDTCICSTTQFWSASQAKVFWANCSRQMTATSSSNASSLSPP
jgi:hypothetical protein